MNTSKMTTNTVVVALIYLSVIVSGALALTDVIDRSWGFLALGSLANLAWERLFPQTTIKSTHEDYREGTTETGFQQNPDT